MTVDEELSLLDENMRRLKIEYDVYFGGGSKKPPADTDWRVQTLIKKFSDSSKLNFSQRFRYNSLAQRYAIFSDLWRKKMKIREEGYSRPQDAMLGIQGIRTEQEHAAEAALKKETSAAEEQAKTFTTACSDVDSEHEKVHSLFQAMTEAKQKTGEAQSVASFESFKVFMKKKTDQIRKEYRCHAVEYSVELENGQVKLKAKAKV